MNLVEFLKDLSTKNVELWVEGDKLRYRAPQHVLIPTLLDKIKEYKAEIISLLQKHTHTAKTYPLLPVARDTALPLSFAQQRLWFLAQLEPDNSFYNIPKAVLFQGQLNIAFLEQSLNAIINRHEALRSNFIIQDGQPVQIIHPPRLWTLPVLDWQHLPENEQKLCWQQLAAKETQHPFDLAEELLIKATLVKLSETEHILLLCLHHIVADGWSIGIFVRELEAFYSTLDRGKTSPLPELPIQYADFAVWQRQWLQGDVLESQLAYWKQQLANAPTLLSLPTDRPRPAVQTFQGANQSFTLPAKLSKALNLLSRQEGVTLFMTLFTAFNTLLYRYTGQEDILVGSPIANRTRSEVEGLIGFFVNTLVLRTNLSRNPSFRELLGQVRKMTLSAYAHQDVPFELLVDNLQPERDLSHTPLFQVMFALQNTPVQKIELPGLTLSPLAVDKATATFDLTLSFESTANKLVGTWEYNTDLFDAATITRMATHFETLLEAIVANPEQYISELPLLTLAEQHQLLVEWNDTQKDYFQNQCIHQLFEKQVEQTPDAVAVVFENQQLTYHELNCQANQLANYLRTIGVGADVLVGICVERSLEMIVGLLGILKAGGAYVPLDPDYPQERLAYILSDAQVTMLLTQQRLMKKLGKHEALLVCLDNLWEQIIQQSTNNPVSEVIASNLANIIYTSGSTGKPKGVMVTHSGLCNLAQAQIQIFNVQANSRVLQFASLSFDASISEIMMSLGSGATLYLGTKDSLLPDSSLIQLLRKYCITHITLPPSALAVLPAEELSTLHTIIVAGEVCSPDILAKWASGRHFFNAYGPTEATVCATVAKANNGSNKLCIGRPIANTQIYILDSYLQPVPIGVIGELYIGGAGLARGYLNRPDLTHEKFIPNPFSDRTQTHLYKTGDLARYLSNGNIEYLCRSDDQVKIRGFRIELGEIEAILSQHPGVLQAVVIAREDSPGDKRLVAYCLLNQEQTPTVSELRRFLREKLPEYMVCSAFVFLEALPLTPNGKVNRRALPVPESHRQLEASLIAPRNPIEQTLALIWADVLKVERVGIYDNFFELGGDSILALQAVARANQAGIKLTPKQLFGHQAIAELATVAGANQIIQAEQGLVTGSLPLTPIQQWFFEQNLPNPDHFNQSVLLEVPPNLQPDFLEQVLQQLLIHHDALRLRFVQKGEHWQQVNATLEETASLKVVNLSDISAEEQSATIAEIGNELQASLDLSTGPLMRAALFYLGNDQPSRLLLIIHHLAVDGVSWRILLEDLFQAYQQISFGEAIQLPPKTSSFQDWANRLTEYQKSEALTAELNYWLAHSDTDFTPFPTDYPTTEEVNTVASAAQVSVSLSIEETRALLQEVPFAYNTQINDILLTALVQSFAQWTGKHSLLVDLEGHGREDLFEDIDLSRTIGWFTTLFPVRLELQNNHPDKALKSIKEQLRSVPKKGIGYGVLRYLSQDVATHSQLQAMPKAEVSFNYLGQFNQELSNSAVWKLAQESGGAVQSPLGNRNHLLEIDGIIIGCQLHINWTYSKNIHQKTTIEHLAQEFIKTLQALIAHCVSPEAGGYTPSDFQLAQLNQDELEQVLANLYSEQEDSQPNWKNVEDIYPLSPMQEGMLFHSLYAPESGVYFEQLICTLKGSLNESAFEQAWQQVINRHSVFRTAFLWEVCDKALQIVYRQVKVSLTTYDWRSLSPSEQQEQLEVFLKFERKRDLPLYKAPLMRLTLIQISENVYQFIWGHHHLLLDGWSLSLVFKEVFTFYEAFCQSKNLYLEHGGAYQNYIAWLQKQDLATAEAFWRQKLKGFTAPTPLTVDRRLSNLEHQQTSYSRQQIQLTVQVTAALQSFARQHQLTLNNLVQGAWALLLHRYSGEQEVVFGATVSGRPPVLVGVESMVGLFINTLPVRVKITEEGKLLPWLKDLQAQQVECEQYAYSPLVDIQRWSEVLQAMPLFESLVVFENYPVNKQEQNSSLEIVDIQVIERTNYPLTMVVTAGLELSLKISYETSRFDDATITRMLGHFQNLLEGIIANPYEYIAQVPMLKTIERHQLLFGWNKTQTDYPQRHYIHQLFEQQVERTPDAVAVVFENQQLTYRELNSKANQLAHYLKTLDVKANMLVGICLERSLEMVVGLLGILKAGAAYVPLDPDYPQERLAYILLDVQVPMLLTQQKLVKKLPEHKARVVYLDTDAPIIFQESEQNLS